MTSRPTALARKTPTISRFLIIGATLALSHAPLQALASQPASLDDALSAALEHTSSAAVTEARITRASARIEAATTRPLPTLQLTHDQVFGHDDVRGSDSFITVTQRVDLSDWRQHLRASLAHREAAELARQRTHRVRVIEDTSRAYFEVAHHSARVATLSSWIEQLERGEANIRARHERGDASLYQVKRVAREVELARARRSAASADLDIAHAELARWTGWEEQRAPNTPLAPPPAVEERDTVRAPALERLRHTSAALEAEASAWGEPFWRGWELGVGYHNARSMQQMGHGVMLSATIPLALWNPDSARVEHIMARRAAVNAELSHQTNLNKRAIAAERAKLAAARRALASLAREQDTDLAQLAQIAFEAGEAPLGDVLDAIESDTELALARLELEWTAREATISITALRGTGAQP